MIKKWYVYWALLCASLSGCTHQQEYQIKNGKQVDALVPDQPQTPKTTELPNKTVTIWVHGTRMSKVVFQNFFRSIPGLQSPLAYNKSNNQFDIAMALFAGDPAHYQPDDVRMFGWSGKLSHEARGQGAHELYEELIMFAHDFEQKYGFKPEFDFITHSHGGNLVLRLVEEAKKHQEQLVINKLILLACPVQQATMAYAQDPMFKNIISIYSPSDLVQVVDPQGIHEVKNAVQNGQMIKKNTPFFSNRRFPAQKNMLQIKVTRHGHGLAHINFLQTPFLKVLPHFLEYISTLKEGEPMQKYKENGFVFSPTKIKPSQY